MKNPCKSLFFLPFFLLSCASNTPVHYARNGLGFNTGLSFHAYEEKAPLLDQLITEADRYSSSLDRYAENNALYKLNHTHDEVEADDVLLGIFNAIEQSEVQALDSFSITMGKVKDAYQSAFDAKKAPNMNAIESLIQEAKNTSYEISGNKIKRIGDGEFDFGGCAKGFFLLKAKEMASKEEAKNYMYNLGQSSILFGESGIDDGSFEVIPDKYPSQRFKIKNASISTSSIFEQSYSIDGVTYSHIIDPIDGNATPKHDYITLVGEDPFILDVYSTAFMNMSVQEIDAVLEGTDIKGFVMEDGKKVYSHGGL